MAKIIEDVLVVKFSRLVKDDSIVSAGVSPETMAAIEQVAQELAGDGVVVEVEAV